MSLVPLYIIAGLLWSALISAVVAKKIYDRKHNIHYVD